MEKGEIERQREKWRERSAMKEGGFIRASGLSPAHSEHVNVSDTGKKHSKRKSEEKRRERGSGREQHDKVSE